MVYGPNFRVPVVLKEIAHLWMASIPGSHLAQHPKDLLFRILKPLRALEGPTIWVYLGTWGVRVGGALGRSMRGTHL